MYNQQLYSQFECPHIYLLLQIDKNRIDASGMIEETAGNEIASSEVKPSGSKLDDSQPIATRTRTSQTRRKPKIE